MKRFLITGTHSGSGKTTITCAVLAALKARGLSLTAFKCGPDFIDPMFHRSVSDIPCWNLDPFFMEPEALRAHLASHSRPEADSVSVMEGVMGYYDGIAGTEEASTYSVAGATETPAVLVVDVSGSGNSIVAVIEGFVRHRADSGIQGVIFNGARESSYPYFSVLAEQAGVKALGFMPRNKDWSIESRHLGLQTAAEIPGLAEKLAALGRQAEASIDIDGLLALAGTAPDLQAGFSAGTPRRDTAHQQKKAPRRRAGRSFLFYLPGKSRTL
jgi:cobyrinic acid a,c-diamide synthase